MDYTTSAYERANYYFPSSENNSSKLFLSDVMLVLLRGSWSSLYFQTINSIFTSFITIIHLFILSKKSMKTSSVMSIMTGIAVCDLIGMAVTFVSNGTNLWFNDDCVYPPTHLHLSIYWLSVVVHDLVRRCSTWLGVLMVLIRYLALKFAMSQKFQKVSKYQFGHICFIGCFLFSLVFSAVYWFRYDIVETGQWHAIEKCQNLPKNATAVQLDMVYSKLFTGSFSKIYMLINGIVTKILPCILFPVLTVLLVFELRRASQNRKSLNGPKHQKTEKTTGLVIFAAITFFLMELPLGIATVLQVAYTDMGYVYIATYIADYCNAFFTVNAIIHSLICFLMSSEYRKTVKKVLGMKTTTTTSTKISVSQVSRSSRN